MDFQVFSRLSYRTFKHSSYEEHFIYLLIMLPRSLPLYTPSELATTERNHLNGRVRGA